MDGGGGGCLLSTQLVRLFGWGAVGVEPCTTEESWTWSPIFFHFLNFSSEAPQSCWSSSWISEHLSGQGSRDACLPPTPWHHTPLLPTFITLTVSLCCADLRSYDSSSLWSVFRGGEQQDLFRQAEGLRSASFYATTQEQNENWMKFSSLSARAFCSGVKNCSLPSGVMTLWANLMLNPLLLKVYIT